MDNEVILSVRNLVKHYSSRKGLFGTGKPRITKAVDGVDLDLHRGEIACIVGQSGSGKSTLLLSIMRLVRPASGKVIFNGTDLVTADARSLARARRDIQMVFQDSYGSLDPYMNVVDTIAEPVRLYNRRGLLEKKLDPYDIEMLALTMMDSVGLERNIAKAGVDTLSGGQRQRVALARSLSLRPGIILADEPVSALDTSVQAQILNLISDIRDDCGVSFLIVSHDLAVVRHISDTVHVMLAGKIVECASNEDFFSHPLHPYSRLLVSSLAGSISAPAETSTEHCPFCTRCPYRMDRCMHSCPPLVDRGGGHMVACFLN